MILWYKNSFLASIVSITGSVMAVAGVYLCIDGDFSGIILILLGIPFLILGRIISDNKSFKKWWKQVTDANLEPKIAADIHTAIAIYNKNPQARTLKKIAKLNPSAAAHIQQSIAAKKGK